MASSKPLKSFSRKGLTTSVCELCENYPKMKWKCLECEFMMCQRCRDKVHPKFCKDDTIIHIRDIRLLSKHLEEQKLDFTKLKCTKHARQYCCLFCKPCCQLVCPICICKIHNKHEMAEIGEGYKIQVDKFRNRQEENVKRIKILSEFQQELSNRKSTEQSSYNKSKNEIVDYKKSLIEFIEKHCDKLLIELNQKWDYISQSILKAEQILKEIQKKLLQQKDEINEIIQSNDAMKVFSSGNLIRSIETNSKPIQATFDKVPPFVPGDLSRITLVYGKLQNFTAPYNTPLKVGKQFTTPYNCIMSLIVCEDDSFWVQKEQGVIQRVKQEDNIMEVVSNFKLKDEYVRDIALTPTGDLLLCIADSPVIKVIPSGTEEIKDSPYKLDMLIKCIHVTQDNKVIIGSEFVDLEHERMGYRPTYIIVLGKSGQEEKEFSFEGHEEPLCFLPMNVTSTSNNNIGVVSYNDLNGRLSVIVLNNEGRVIYVYTGHPDVNRTGSPFTPAEITTTPSDNFVIADFNNHTLHILTSYGKVITRYNTEKLGIELPYFLSFSRTGQLYIGCATYKDSEKKAKIYKIVNFVW